MRQDKHDSIQDILEKLVIEQPSALNTGCWVWLGYNRKGYGCSSIRGKRVVIHRAVYAHFCGNIPEGYTIHHRCGNRACANFEHLEALSSSDHQRHHRSGQTYCKNGHLLSGDNLYINPHSKGRVCRICNNEWRRSYRKRNIERYREYWRKDNQKRAKQLKTVLENK